MAINYTTLLGLAQPVTGTEANTWGTVVNDEITALLDSAVAGAASLNVTAGNVTLTATAGVANQARMAILIATGTPGTTRNIIAPSQSKTYIVVNQSNASVVLKGSATAGVTIRAGQAATCVWNGADFEIVASGDVDGPASATDNAIARYDGTTGKLIQNSSVTLDDSNNVSGVVQLNATTLDATNLEVTNLKAKDGTAAGSIADSTGVVTLASSVLTTTDINGGTVDGTTIGAATPSTVVATQVDITAQGDLRLQDTTGGQYVALQAPGTIATSYTLTLPVDDGTSGQALITDGSGVLSWSSAAANVSSISFGSTGLTPSTATSGVVTVAGTLAIANGGTGATTNTNARTNLGATTLGSNIFTITNPSAITFPRFNADNTVSSLDAATFRTAIGAGTGSGTVTGVTATAPVASSGGAAPAISLNAAYGDTLNPYASKTANFVLAAPNGTAGVPTFRAVVAADIPTLNQNTTGTAAISTAATITTSATASAFKVPFANTTVSTTGNYGLLQDSAAEFTYNPSTNTLTVGTVSGALSGNATTATTLATARNINGTSFNGSADITTANWGTARTLWGQSVNGSANITAPLLPAAGSVSAPAFSTSGDTNTGVFFPAADTIAFVQGGLEVLRINSSSNVGIGTTSPAAKLAVVGTGYSPTITLTDGATLNWDTSLGQVAQVTLAGNRTFAAPTNLVNGGFYSLLIIQDGTGSRTISWNAVFDFTGGTAPTLSTAAGAKDIITWRSDGTNLLEVGRSLGVA